MRHSPYSAHTLSRSARPSDWLPLITRCHIFTLTSARMATAAMSSTLTTPSRMIDQVRSVHTCIFSTLTVGRLYSWERSESRLQTHDWHADGQIQLVRRTRLHVVDVVDELVRLVQRPTEEVDVQLALAQRRDARRLGQSGAGRRIRPATDHRQRMLLFQTRLAQLRRRRVGGELEMRYDS